ncbi:drug/metabolite transporter superfamily protein [Nitzschia inconspicua]|uniref:Drug/metabolite transporter superfamily protein n=1 Tax=Nitzschia inconspicua TaxID=303405 RepID=A0A9K3LV95_9STRA|nr:drug/metabolite transporter superfamily protein [Nitzschia inconspicua]
MSTSEPTTSCELCGWIAAVLSIAAFGSFGVPIKSDAAKACDIDPLCMQTYKTVVCLLTSWIVLLWEPFSYTPWGIISGLFWVPGGVATVFAIKNAGLAIAIGVGGSCIVLVSFTWGILVFGEHVHNRIQASMAVALMLMGLVGMAYYSAPTVAHNAVMAEESSDGIFASPKTAAVRSYQEVELEDRSTPSSEHNDDSCRDGPGEDEVVTENEAVAGLKTASPPLGSPDVDTRVSIQEDLAKETSHILFCGIRWQRRLLGILAAAFNGCYGGSIMVPMKFAPPTAVGAAYVISFAIGATMVTAGLWFGRFLYHFQRECSFSQAYGRLPSFYFRQMWLAGGLCGLLWSIGNFFSILSVKYLGEGVGYSVVQLNLLVSGVWGIAYFGEVQGKETIIKWFISAVVAVTGILLLSYEHHAK